MGISSCTSRKDPGARIGRRMVVEEIPGLVSEMTERIL